ncbi:hypothetical protein RB213_005525, partial [Colletotrichum asianum]
MTGDFAYFPRLPAELRLEIWRLAIRPARIKSVQFFGTQDTHVDLTEDSRPAYPIMEDDKYVLTTPRFQSGLGQLKVNESGYTLDAEFQRWGTISEFQVASIAFEYDTSWELGDKTMPLSDLLQAGGSRGCFLRFLEEA